MEADAAESGVAEEGLEGAGEVGLLDRPAGRRGEHVVVLGHAPSLAATGNHPFWVAELKKWVNADQFEPGQWLSTSRVCKVPIRHRH